MNKTKLLGSCIAMYLLAFPGLTMGQSKDHQPELKKNSPMITNLFIENKGQVKDLNQAPVPGALYVAAVNNARLYFFKDHVSYVISRFNQDENQPLSSADKLNLPKTKSMEQHRVDLVFENPNKGVLVNGTEMTETSFSYSLSAPASEHARSYNKVVYNNIYPGVDIEFYFNGTGLEYDFIVHRGGKVSDIRYHYDGGESVKLLGKKQLNIATKLGMLSEAIPESYVLNNKTGAKSAVSVDYAMNKKHISLVPEKAVSLGEDETLVIDPTLTYQSVLGSNLLNGETFGLDVDVNNTNDDYYLAGYTKASNYPATAGWSPQATYQGGLYDGFVARFNTSGTLLTFTYIGGSGDDFVTGVKVVDIPNPNITIAGSTTSNTILGVTRIASPRTDFDAFVIKYTPVTAAINFVTFYGDPVSVTTHNNQFAYALEMDGSSRTFIGGYSDGNQLVYSPGAFNTNPNATAGFVAVFNNAGASVGCRRVGDTSANFMAAFVTDLLWDKGTNTMVVTGHTMVPGINFEPTLSSPALQSTNNGNWDIFVIRLHMSLAVGFTLQNLSPTAGTLLGGDNSDQWPRVAMYNNTYAQPLYPNIYVTFTTQSSNMDVLNYTSGASLRPTFNISGSVNTMDAFVAVLNNTLNTTSYLYGSYVGGVGNFGVYSPSFDQACDILVDKFNNFYVYGISSERSWFVTVNLTTPGGEFTPYASEVTPAYFLAKFRSNYTLDFACYVGPAITPAASPAGYGLQFNGTNYNEISRISMNNCNDQLYLTGNTVKVNTGTAWAFTHAYVRKVSIGTCGQSWKRSTGINDTEDLAGQTTVFPNPAKDVVSLSFNGAVTSVEITDITGRVVYSNNNPGNTAPLQVNSSEWKPGVYFVKTYNGNDLTGSEKFVKE